MKWTDVTAKHCVLYKFLTHTLSHLTYLLPMHDFWFISQGNEVQLPLRGT